MLWFKHRSDARNSLKLRKVRRKYGADGYAIYWFCLEAIAYDVDKDNLTFELKEDAETIAFELTIQEKRVEEIMLYMIKVGLFESSSNMITCMKLAESIDKSMTNSPKMRKWLERKSVMTSPDDDKTCAELEVEVDKIIKEDIKPIVKPEAKPSKYKFDDYHMEFAEWMLSKFLILNPNFKKPNLESWANTLRLMIEVDKRDPVMIGKVFEWANKDSFWSSNILSANSLRKQFDKLVVKVNQPVKAKAQMNSNDTSWVNLQDDML